MRESKSRRQGNPHFEDVRLNQRGETVVEMQRKIMVGKRDHAPVNDISPKMYIVREAS